MRVTHSIAYEAKSRYSSEVILVPRHELEVVFQSCRCNVNVLDSDCPSLQVRHELWS